jgi:flagellar basal-body rod modification protein FlgD
MALTINSYSNNAAAKAADVSSDTQKKTDTKSLESPSKEMFLQLLVAQIKNQDPLNPADGTQFLSQLAQFSELEQLIGIREGISAINTSVAAEAAATDRTAQ